MLRSFALVALAAALAAPASAQDRPRPDRPRAERADTVEFKIGRRIQIVRAPGTERQQRIQIVQGRDTTDVGVDVNLEAVEGWMRRILVIGDDTTDVGTAPADSAPPVRIRLRSRRGDAPRDRSGERVLELRTRDGRVLRDTLRDGAPLPEAWRQIAPATIASMHIERVDLDGARLLGRRGGLRVERIEDGMPVGGDVVILRETERPGGDVRLFRDGAAGAEEAVRVVREGDTVRIEHGGQTRTVRLRRTPETRRDGTLVVPDGKGGTWIYLPPPGQ